MTIEAATRRHSARSIEIRRLAVADRLVDAGSVGSDSGTIIAKLSARPRTTTIENMVRGPERKQAMWNALQATAVESQKDVIARLASLKDQGVVAGYESLSSPNAVVIRPAQNKSKDVLAALKDLTGIASYYDGKSGAALAADGSVAKHPHGEDEAAWGIEAIGPPVVVNRPHGATGEPQWNQKMIGAPEAWAAGVAGEGAVYGSIDTGVDGTHPELAPRYRGGQGPDAQHDYNWMDFNHNTKSPVPKDYDSHGTHTTSTAVGETVGVAPKAKWVAAHGLVDGGATLLRSMQWMQAPTKRDGTAPDPQKAPDVVGMSFFTGPNHGDFFADSMKNLSAAGIEPVKSAGNKGNGPETITSPGQFAEVWATAAVDANRDIAPFSSRGPSPLPHGANGKAAGWKPDFAAPGVDIVAAIPGGKFGKMSGTSMAQPHFAGALAALIAQNPGIKRAALDGLLQKTVQDAGAKGRDLEFGHGIINLGAAAKVQAEELAKAKTPASEPATPVKPKRTPKK